MRRRNRIDAESHRIDTPRTKIHIDTVSERTRETKKKKKEVKSERRAKGTALFRALPLKLLLSRSYFPARTAEAIAKAGG